MVRPEKGAHTTNHVLVQESTDKVANRFPLALEDNCTIYHVVDGRRVSFRNQNVKVATNRWHTLKVEAVGDHFVVWCDDKVVLDARDRMFEDAGKVGLWTKADSVVEFDDLSVEGR